MKSVISQAKKKMELSGVNDQFGSPTYARDLARGICRLVKKSKFGTYHMTNKGHCSWYEFAKEIVNKEKINCRINPASSKDIIRPAPRPRTSILLNSKVGSLRHWKKALQSYLDETK